MDTIVNLNSNAPLSICQYPLFLPYRQYVFFEDQKELILTCTYMS